MSHASRLSLGRALALIVTLLGAAACGDDTTSPPPRALTTVSVSVGNAAVEVGQLTVATAAGFDQEGAPIATGPVTWSSDAPTIAGVSPTTGFIFGVAPGTTRITATVDGKVGERTITVAKAPAIRINEVQSRGDQPGGWIEFFNPTEVAVDMSGWTLIDSNFFGPFFTFPAGSVVQPGGQLVIEEATLPFGVDASDHVHLFSRFGVLVDAAFWIVQPATTYGLCPNGTGSFVTTTAPSKGTVNACPAGASVSLALDAARNSEEASVR